MSRLLALCKHVQATGHNYARYKSDSFEYNTCMSIGNGHNNNTRKGLTNSLQSFDKESVDFPGSIRYYINNEGALMPRTSRKDTNMANVFIVSSSSSSDLAFASLGTALQYVRDAHADENPEGSALMLQTPSGLVPESTGAVRERSACGLRASFRAVADSSDADKVRSQLAGAVKACALIGVDPSSVAKVTELREALAALTEGTEALSGTVSYEIKTMALHKRRVKRSI